jgi:hypothetical protein
VDPRVLVPRPETELLVEAVLQAVPRDAEIRVLDLCTGSGCVGITLALERPRARVLATDASPGAVEVARANAAALGPVDRFEARLGDLLAPVEGEAPFDVVVANPPYVPTGQLPTLSPEVRREPPLALDGGADGLDVVRRIAEDARAASCPAGSSRWRSATVRVRRSTPCSRRPDMAPSASNATSLDTIAWPSGHTPAARRPRTQETERLDQIHIDGGTRLEGEVRVSGSKNATLPLMAAALLGEGPTTLRNVPRPGRRHHPARAAPDHGRRTPTGSRGGAARGPGACPAGLTPEAPYDLVRKMRASVLVLGPLLARFGRARVSLPGGAPSAPGRSTST